MSNLENSGGVLRGLVRIPLEEHESDVVRLKVAAENTNDRLYVMVEGDWGKFTRDQVQKRLLFIYDQLNRANNKLDARVLLPAPMAHLAPHALGIEVVFSSPEESTALDSWNELRKANSLPPIAKRPSSVPCPPALQNLCWGAETCENVPSGCYDNVVLGGTFDRIHSGHKLLLSTSALYTKKRLAIGISEGALLAKKTLKEFMSSFTARQVRLLDFLLSVKPGLDYHLVPITDPFGPSIVYPELDCIVVSKETESGGAMVNERRVANGLNSLVIEVVDLVGPEGGVSNDTKVSSTQQRKNALAIFCGQDTPIAERAGGEEGLQDWCRLTDPEELPYVIALTGGIASGKSSVSAHLATLGVPVIDCDKLGHKAYEKGSATFGKVVEAFGEAIVDKATGEIDRRALGGIVFSPDKPEALPMLNSIVWPAIQELAQGQMKELRKGGTKVVVMEAAILLEAGWDKWCDEVWVVMVPEDVAKARLMERNSFPEEEALKRIRSQKTNAERLVSAHVIFGNQWALADTAKQVEKAWEGVSWRMAQDLGGGGEGMAEGSLPMRWKQACTALGIAPPLIRSWWRRLRALYTGPGRFYHTLSHLRAMFQVLASLAPPLQRPDLVALAIFFHDAIYDPKSGDNEAKSAELFREFASEAGGTLSGGDVDAVSSWILRTATHHSGPAEGDLAALLDVDLSILGAAPSLYDKYAEAIMLEYSHFAYPEFLPKRIQVLEKMIAQESLYFTPEGKAQLDGPARENMRREVVRCQADLAKFPL